MSVKELEAAISKLSLKELAELASWFAEFHAEAWDRQIEADVRAGKLDKMAGQAKEDHAAGKTRPL